MSTVFADVSEWQRRQNPDGSTTVIPYDQTYPRQFIMCRVANENGGIDLAIGQNLPRITAARTVGKLANFGGYIIPCLIPNARNLAILDQVGFPPDAVVMIDMEGWGGKVAGDHSADLNALATALRTRQGGRPDLVWGYGNRNDLGGIWPSRSPWLGFIVAGYGSANMDAPGVNMIGWQYTNGAENGTGMPSASAPFGACDHNVLYVPIPLPSGDEMTPEDFATVQTMLHDSLLRFGQALLAGHSNALFTEADLVSMYDTAHLNPRAVPGMVDAACQHAIRVQFAPPGEASGRVVALLATAIRQVAAPTLTADQIAAIAAKVAAQVTPAVQPAQEFDFTGNMKPKLAGQ